MPVVSVIIPTYNRVAMVKEAIQSVLEQTYPDYEIIVVDDGSTDDTRNVVPRLSDRIVYARQPNRGCSAARNHGISLAKGKYVAFLDSDDLFLPSKLDKQVTVMEKNPGVLLSHTSYQRFGDTGDYTEVIKSGKFTGNVYPKIIRRCPVFTSTVMVRREALDENRRFEETIALGEDIILWIRIARASPIIGINETLTRMRIRGSNAVFDSQAQITGVMNIIEYKVKREPDIRTFTRQNLLSDGYLKIGFHYLRMRKARKWLKFMWLALRSSPLYMIYWIPTTLFAELFTRRWLWRSTRLTGKSGSSGE